MKNSGQSHWKSPMGNLERKYLGGTCACVVPFVRIVRSHHKLVKPMFTLISVSRPSRAGFSCNSLHVLLFVVIPC